MNIQKITKNEIQDVISITQNTIDYVYPKYYSAGAIKYFKSHHNDESILADIEKGIVFCLFENDKAVGTVTVDDNHILRLFVLPECQGNGYGRSLLDFAEKQIANNSDEIVLDASFPAKNIYLKRGYKESEFCKVETENGDFLCYDVMTKKI